MIPVPVIIRLHFFLLQKVTKYLGFWPKWVRGKSCDRDEIKHSASATLDIIAYKDIKFFVYGSRSGRKGSSNVQDTATYIQNDLPTSNVNFNCRVNVNEGH